MTNKTKQIEEHIRAVMELLDIKETESNKDTPKRIAKMYVNEVFKNRENDLSDLNSQMTLFNNDGSQEPITMKDIKFNSMCEHHWLPFFGTVTVTYVPDSLIIGLSKIPRVIKFFSQKPQLQERLTKEIGDYLVNLLNPKYLKVEVTATHTCVMCRGAESECETTTQYTYGR